jgi:glutathione synthase/RimK-type ligase-like ATP-grasp enzyme
MGTDVLLAVDASTAELTPDDALLAAAMDARGLRPRPHRWGRPVEHGAIVVIRSTWDYIQRPAVFLAWLDHLDAQQAIVHNATNVLRWNTHKRYLVDLERHGVPVVETALVPRGTRRTLEELIDERGWDDVVVKPAVGGTARLAEHRATVGHTAAAAHLRRIVTHEDAVVQPFISTITTLGETSVVAVGEKPRLAVAKRARRGDWRVQTEFGGSVEPTDLTDELRSIAGRALAAVHPTPAYARVDVVRDELGVLRVLELELVEPELFFRLSASLADDLAAHIERSLSRQHA